MSDDDPSVSGYMPLWIGDYVADTMALTYPEHGAYLRLIMAHWRSGPLRDDVQEFSMIVGCDPRTWRNILARKLVRYFRVENGFWYHDRVLKEKAKAIDLKRKIINRSRKAAATRWGDKVSSSNASTPRYPMLVECPSPSPIEEIGVTDVTPSLHQSIAADAACQPSPAKPATVDLIGDPVSEGSEGGKGRLRCPVKAIVELYHAKLPTARRVMVMTPAREQAITARWRFYAAEKGWQSTSDGLTFFGEFFDFVARSAFLTGRVSSRDGRPFVADLAWLMKAENFAKTAEGKYHG